MAENGRTLLRRITAAKNSLENAEKSFLNKRELRGELDLMLAEAELKNLRRRDSSVWCWNRQLLAVLCSVLLVISGLSGWFYARKNIAPQSDRVAISEPVRTQIQATAAEQKPALENSSFKEEHKTVASEVKQNIPVDNLDVSRDEVRRLVQAARVELRNSK